MSDRDARNAIIWNWYVGGKSYADIGAALDLSASRVRHICNRLAHKHGIEPPPARLCMLGDQNPQARRMQNGR